MTYIIFKPTVHFTLTTSSNNINIKDKHTSNIKYFKKLKIKNKTKNRDTKIFEQPCKPNCFSSQETSSNIH